jgi:NAD(P)-dependent dehydrogenase (short-subunit alcohol dehydrogenase family)
MWRCGKPEEVVGAAMFFATDKSSYASGAILRLDGGCP